jgi:nitrous oxidase accessory protein NosD
LIRDNTISNNDIGIATVSDAVKSTNNVLQNNRDEGILLNDGSYVASNNRISGSLIGVALDSDGFVASPTTGNLKGNDFIGTFATALVQVVTLSGSPYGGSNIEPVTLTLNGFSETVTGGTSSSPSIVNITSQGSMDHDH